MTNSNIIKKDLVKIEGNACEYPLFSFSKSKKNITDEEKIKEKHYREFNLGVIVSETGEVEERKLILRSPLDFPLPGAFEQDILMAISYIGTQKNTLTKRIFFSLYEVAKLIGQPSREVNIKEGIKKMAHVTCEAKHTVMVKNKNGKTRYLNGEEYFHIFARTSFWNEKEDVGKRKSQEVTWVEFNEYFVQNFLSGYFQYIDFSKYISLSSPIAKRLYVFLSKKKFARSEFKISIKKLASVIPIEAKRLSDVRIRLKEACKHLEREGIIRGYKLEKRAMDITFYFPLKEVTVTSNNGVDNKILQLSDREKNIYEQLIKSGITDGVVKQLMKDYSVDKIEQQLKWLNSRKSIDDPAGALVSSIRYDWAPPKEIHKDKENKETQKQIESLLKKANNAKYIVLPSGKKRQILKVSDNVIEFIDENERRMIPTNQALNCKFED